MLNYPTNGSANQVTKAGRLATVAALASATDIYVDDKTAASGRLRLTRVRRALGTPPPSARVLDD